MNHKEGWIWNPAATTVGKLINASMQIRQVAAYHRIWSAKIQMPPGSFALFLNQFPCLLSYKAHELNKNQGVLCFDKLSILDYIFSAASLNWKGSICFVSLLSSQRKVGEMVGSGKKSKRDSNYELNTSILHENTSWWSISILKHISVPPQETILKETISWPNCLQTKPRLYQCFQLTRRKNV